MLRTGSQSVSSDHKITFQLGPQTCIKTSLLFQRSSTLGAGVRDNINDKCSFFGGLIYMHISNRYLSQPALFNDGIDVYGPMFGFDVRLGKPRHRGSE